MFKNNVFKVSVSTQQWLKAAGIRAIKTTAQAAIAAIGTSVAIGDINWVYVASSSIVAGLLSVLTSVAGIPEVESEE